MDSSIDLGGSRMGVGCGWKLFPVGDAAINRGGGSLSVGGVVSKLTLGMC